MKGWRFVGIVSLYALAMIVSPPWLRALLSFPFGAFCGRALNEWKPRR